MSLQVPLPWTLNADTMHSLLGAAIYQGAPIDNHVQLDFYRVNFVEPAGVVILSNLIEWLRKRGVIVEYINADTQRRGVEYLDDTGLFATYWGASLSQFAKLRGTTFPFRALQCANSHQWLDGNIFPWLQARLNIRRSSLYGFQACVREIFNNIIDHSEEDVGCMHVQLLPNIHRMKIAISDFGIGIPTEVRRAVPGLSEPAAIARATQEGFSSKGGKNRGAGLSYLVDIIVKNNNGWLGIYSGNGAVTFNHVTRFPNVRLMAGSYPGTLISMIFRTDDLANDSDEESEDLIW
ncbi:MAG: putative CheA signal transduction histidine kinase [Alphaproteobacteria bacterium]|nr:putative CheA signal transduction histidine kinase [Alphaproteobacteria bacterium]